MTINTRFNAVFLACLIAVMPAGVSFADPTEAQTLSPSLSIQNTAIQMEMEGPVVSLITSAKQMGVPEDIAKTLQWHQVVADVVDVFGREGAEERLKKIAALIERLRSDLDGKVKEVPSGGVALITYAHSIQDGNHKHLKVLEEFINRYDLKSVFDVMHILPHFPSDTDAGFSVMDYYNPDPDNGTWENVQNLAKEVVLMFDFVANHCSVNNELVQNSLIEWALLRKQEKTGSIDKRYETYASFKNFTHIFSNEQEQAKDFQMSLKGLKRPRPFYVLSRFAVLEYGKNLEGKFDEKTGQLFAVLTNDNNVTKITTRRNMDRRVFESKEQVQILVNAGILKEYTSDKEYVYWSENINSLSDLETALSSADYHDHAKVKDIFSDTNRPTSIVGETGWVWTTFSRADNEEDGTTATRQVDLNFSEFEISLKTLEIFAHYAANGASLVREDAIGYIWKELGSESLHEPECHTLLRLYNNVMKIVSPNLVSIAEINEDQNAAFKYLGEVGENARANMQEADWVYDFGNSPIAHHAFSFGTAKYLRNYRDSLSRSKIGGRKFTPINSTHDGLPFKPQKGHLPDTEQDWLANLFLSRGSEVSSGKVPIKDKDGKVSGQESIRYEASGTAWHILNGPETEKEKGYVDEPDTLKLQRYLAHLSVGLFNRGMPAVYLNGLFGSANNKGHIGEPRDYNRQIFDKATLFNRLDNLESKLGKRFHAVKNMLMVRKKFQHIFGRDGEAIQNLKSSKDDLVLTSLAEASDGSEAMVELVNVTKEKVNIIVDLRGLSDYSTEYMRDVFAYTEDDTAYAVNKNGYLHIELAPYQVTWLNLNRNKNITAVKVEVESVSQSDLIMLAI